jgi:hypothetical protein
VCRNILGGHQDESVKFTTPYQAVLLNNGICKCLYLREIEKPEEGLKIRRPERVVGGQVPLSVP